MQNIPSFELWTSDGQGRPVSRSFRVINFSLDHMLARNDHLQDVQVLHVPQMRNAGGKRFGLQTYTFLWLPQGMKCHNSCRELRSGHAKNCGLLLIIVSTAVRGPLWSRMVHPTACPMLCYWTRMEKLSITAIFIEIFVTLSRENWPVRAGAVLKGDLSSK